MCANGRYVAFESDAANLVPGDTNDCSDVFVRDTLLGTTIRASTSASGAEANGSSYRAAIATDASGTVYVAFDSSANNLVPGDTDFCTDVFVKNLSTGEVTRVSTVQGPTICAASSSSSGSTHVKPSPTIQVTHGAAAIA